MSIVMGIIKIFLSYMEFYFENASYGFQRKYLT